MKNDYLKVARDKPIGKNSLIGIYTATMTDTGCFRYGNTDNKCHQIAIDTLNTGIETHKIYQQIYENSTKSRIKLMGKILSNLNYELKDLLAWFVIDENMMKMANASKSDVDGFTDMVRSIKGVEVALMIFQQNESSCRINFRSKGNYIINDIAKKIGGGGHAFAAGAVVDGALNDVVTKVTEITIQSIKTKMTKSLI